MKKTLLFTCIISILITNTAMCQERIASKNKYAVFSWENVRNNPEKVSMGYIGYWSGIGTSITVLSGLNPSLWWGALLAAPITGSLGASAGVYLAGDMQNQTSRLDQTLYGGLKGGFLGGWNWIVPIPFVNPFLLNPASPTLHAIDQYNAHAQDQIDKKAFSSSISTNPIYTVWGLGRLVGHSKSVDTPIMIAFETKVGSLKTLYLEGVIQDQKLDKENKDWFDGEIFAKGSWRRKYYGLTIGRRSYSLPSRSGWFYGYGTTLFYSSLTEAEGNIKEWNMYSGNGYFIKPHVELGYHLNLTKHFYILGGYRFGPTFSFNTSGEHNKVLQEQPYKSLFNGIGSSILIRSGWSW